MGWLHGSVPPSCSGPIPYYHQGQSVALVVRHSPPFCRGSGARAGGRTVIAHTSCVSEANHRVERTLPNDHFSMDTVRMTHFRMTHFQDNQPARADSRSYYKHTFSGR